MYDVHLYVYILKYEALKNKVFSFFKVTVYMVVTLFHWTYFHFFINDLINGMNVDVFTIETSASFQFDNSIDTWQYFVQS